MDQRLWLVHRRMLAVVKEYYQPISKEAKITIPSLYGPKIPPPSEIEIALLGHKPISLGDDRLCVPNAEEHGTAEVGTRLLKAHHAEILVKKAKGGTVGQVPTVGLTRFTGLPLRRVSCLMVSRYMAAIV